MPVSGSTTEQDTHEKMSEVCEGLGDIVTESVCVETGNNGIYLTDPLETNPHVPSSPPLTFRITEGPRDFAPLAQLTWNPLPRLLCLHLSGGCAGRPEVNIAKSPSSRGSENLSS